MCVKFEVNQIIFRGGSTSLSSRPWIPLSVRQTTGYYPLIDMGIMLAKHFYDVRNISQCCETTSRRNELELVFFCCLSVVELLNEFDPSLSHFVENWKIFHFLQTFFEGFILLPVFRVCIKNIIVDVEVFQELD